MLPSVIQLNVPTKPALVKIGGSIATVADGDHVNRNVLMRLAGEFREAGIPLVLVHGTGHVGKPWAHRGGFATSGYLPPWEKKTSLTIRSELRSLNRKIVECLSHGGLRAIGMEFESWQELGRRHPSAARHQIEEHLHHEETPVFFGDMLAQPEGGYRVYSSDRMLIDLARRVPFGTGLLLTDVEGVLGGTPERLLPEVSEGTLAHVARRTSDDADVSAGMRGKLANAFVLARHVERCFIASGMKPGVARDLLLRRDAPATRIVVDP